MVRWADAGWTAHTILMVKTSNILIEKQSGRLFRRLLQQSSLIALFNASTKIDTHTSMFENVHCLHCECVCVCAFTQARACVTAAVHVRHTYARALTQCSPRRINNTKNGLKNCPNTKREREREVYSWKSQNIKWFPWQSPNTHTRLPGTHLQIRDQSSHTRWPGLLRIRSAVPQEIDEPKLLIRLSRTSMKTVLVTNGTHLSLSCVRCDDRDAASVVAWWRHRARALFNTSHTFSTGRRAPSRSPAHKRGEVWIGCVR